MKQYISSVLCLIRQPTLYNMLRHMCLVSLDLFRLCKLPVTSPQCPLRFQRSGVARYFTELRVVKEYIVQL